MKPSRRIFMLTGLVFAIVMFWLMPGVNTAKHVRYTRKYEDTDAKPALVTSDTTKRKTIAARKNPPAKKKVYKTETIEEEATLRDIDSKMFSRAIHFEEELLLAIDEDSVIDLEVVITDSISYAGADSLTTSRGVN